jgi:hypothetical protein
MDREKVIKGLEICAEHGSWHGLDCEHNEAYKDCPYRGCETGCVVTIAKDAISLLKEQDAVEPFHRCIGKEFSLIEDSHFDYCPYCGKPITWAKQEGR